jgi:hypothetical protein
LVPYFVGGFAFCVAGSFNPVGMKVVVISAAAASFGGASGLAWLAPWATRIRDNGQTPKPVVEMKRDWRWITCGLASGAMLVFVLGPGVKFGV